MTTGILGVKTFLWYIYNKVYNVLELFLKNHTVRTVRLEDPTAAVGMVWHIELWFTSRMDCLIMAYTWNVAKFQ